MIKIVQRLLHNRILIESDKENYYLDMGLHPSKQLIIMPQEMEYVQEISEEEKNEREKFLNSL